MFELSVLIIASLLNSLLGYVVFNKNPHSATNRLFFVMTGSFVVWSVVNYLSIHPVLLPQLVLIRLVLFCAAFLSLCVYLTFTTFPDPVMKGSPKVRRLLLGLTLAVMLLTLTPLVFKGLTVSHGNASPQPNFGIALFGVLAVGLLGGGVWNLVARFHKAKGTERDQFRLVILGLVGTFGLIVLTNFVLVVLFKNSSLIPLGPAFTLIFTGALGYAIVRHRLFDIRLLVARSLAYVLSWSAMGAIFAISTFGISNLIFGNRLSINELRWLYTVLAVFLALLFPSLKRFFDKMTNRFFYRDAYETQTFLDNFNKILVATYQLAPLLRKSANMINATLNPSYCVFVIKQSNGQTLKVTGTYGYPDFTTEDLDLINRRVPKTESKIVVSDLLDHGHLDLQKTLKHNDVAVLANLTSVSTNSGVGYLILGPKKSGNIYSKQDLKVIEIIANELVIAVQNALRFEEIQNFNLTLQAKVDEATKKLRRANEKLKEMDETKDDFISMASHQLRTPLTSVKGYLSMTLEGDGGKLNSRQKDMLQQAFFSSQRMVYLIADLLNVSRLKTGKFVIEAVPTNLATIVDQELDQLQETAKAKSLTLIYHQPHDFPPLMLDETKIRQVIMNFSDNAIYYTPPGGQIEVRLTETPTNVEFRVVDNGIGVPKSEQHHLFTKFYRAGNARKARPDGTGLGLFMAKKVVLASGGSLIFESQEGKGSTFGFSFNKTKLAPPQS